MRTLIFFLLLAAPLHAKTIRGTVTTPAGDAIAGAMVAATDVEALVGSTSQMTIPFGISH